ncbi:MAG: alpha/beta hydrolase [Methylococcales bacterium]
MATVYFATNRNPNNEKKPTDFGKSFSNTNLGDLRFGQAEVKKSKLDINSIKVLPDNSSQGSQALFTELRQSMKSQSLDSLVFIHGFNNDFKAAIESAAKIGERFAKLSNKSYQPNIFVFSWPSDGDITGYGNDRHDAEASGYAFARGLVKLSGFLTSAEKGEACQQKINLIAHSMGNYVLRHALQQAKKIANGAALPRIFENIILTAADEDNDAFDHDHKLAKLPELAQRVTVYFNNGDLALTTSDLTKGNPDRLGHDGPTKPHQVPAKVVIVDVSDVVKGVSEHSYHAENDKVGKDMIAVLRGENSEKIADRDYVPHANKFRLL